MLLLAVTAVEKMKELPADTWLKIGIAVGAVILSVVLVRKLMKTNKVVASLVGLVVLAIVFFSWVYNRNEPKFLSPLVDRIAPFFPSASGYGAKQKTPPRP